MRVADASGRFVAVALSITVACGSAESTAPGASDAGHSAPASGGSQSTSTPREAPPGGVSGNGAPGGAPSQLADASAPPSVHPTRDAAMPLVLSDGFETAPSGGPPSAPLWTIARPSCSGSGTLAVDGSVAHTGQQSVRVDGGGGYCDHVFFATSSALAGVGRQLYARLFVRLGSALGVGHVSFLTMTDASDGGKHVRLGGQDGVLMYNRESDDATLPVLSPTGVALSIAPAPDVWTCLELHIDEEAGTIDTWADGQQVTGMTETGSPVPDVSTEWLRSPWKPSITDFMLGWESYAGRAMTLWFDDVALAGQRIGCGT